MIKNIRSLQVDLFKRVIFRLIFIYLRDISGFIPVDVESSYQLLKETIVSLRL